jgi:hypothetical protein
MTDEDETERELRNAADEIDSARAILLYGELNGPSHEIETFINRLDRQLDEMSNTLRELANLTKKREHDNEQR